MPPETTGLRVEPGGVLSGRLRVPGDKSISHRAVMFGALAEGETTISGFLESEDTRATIAAFKAMGVRVEAVDGPGLQIAGVGLHGLKPPPGPVDLGNSGTGMRLLAGLMAGQNFDVTLTGDASLCKRPMTRITEPLAAMGASISSADNGRPPLTVHGGGDLSGIDYVLPVASAQVKSCVLLAGLYAQGRTQVTEFVPTRDHTERMLESFGYTLQRERNSVSLQGGGRLSGTNIPVPADISSAAFFMVGAALAPGSDLLLEGVGINPTRTGVIQILQLMGADISLENEGHCGTELVADIRVRYRPLHGVEIPHELVPLAIDEFPALLVAAACAEGETVLENAGELRVKESDRIAAMAEGLRGVGVNARETADGMILRGGAIRGGEVHSFGDHRIAMAFAMAGLRAEERIHIYDTENVDTSFPGFADMARAAGLRVQAELST